MQSSGLGALCPKDMPLNLSLKAAGTFMPTALILAIRNRPESTTHQLLAAGAVGDNQRGDAGHGPGGRLWNRNRVSE